MSDDVLIVGGGVIGLSLAYELSCHGMRVRVIDDDPPGRIASWAGAGILPPAATQHLTHPLDELRALSFQLHGDWAQQLREETGLDNGFRRCGGLYLGTTAGEAASLIGIRQTWEEEGITVELRDGVTARRELGIDDSNDSNIRAALYLPDESQIRNPRHLRALRTGIENRGGTIESNCPAVEFKHSGDSIQSVMTPNGKRVAGKYALCAGPWTQPLLDELGVTADIYPIRGQMLLFRFERPPFRCVVNHGSRYLVPRDDGFVLAGSTEEEVGFACETTEEQIGELLEFTRSLHPQLNRDNLIDAWAGLRPETYDGLPYLGGLSSAQNGYVAAGHFRNGLYLSPATARVLGQLIRGETPQIDLEPFRITRG